ncbi:MAG TPA: division/cell wall cluster transcriptional repressor MraZ [Candidatus Hydrogenedentes bacterium]|nr:division/cell wall cluster transcriptional repressor MraZ [Candidatus Hydrogenedentota bacterium]HQH52154.1 division/cell wall cluster transcriptional repressor MraZ [Candidatus Hydrogenedentota bacterium]HQM48296.1 division/cell wall cluster transcriptional repressor MraZ [Candidatus Hydrogenedentota bacterium]
MYFGEYAVKVDDKGRLTVPSRLRQCMDVEGDAVWYLTRGFDGCISVYPRDEWRRIRAQVSRYSSMNAKALVFRRLFFSSMGEARIDGQGRMAIPPHLREMGKIGTEEEAVLIGIADHLEIWNRERWRSFQNTNEAAYKEMATLISMADGMQGVGQAVTMPPRPGGGEATMEKGGTTDAY